MDGRFSVWRSKFGTPDDEKGGWHFVEELILRPTFQWLTATWAYLRTDASGDAPFTLATTLNEESMKLNPVYGLCRLQREQRELINIICAIAFIYEKAIRGGNLLPKVWSKKHHLSRKKLSHIVCDKEKFAGYEAALVNPPEGAFAEVL